METLAIIGSGTMGHSIALCAAVNGLPVTLWGVDERNVKDAICGIDNKLATLAENGLLEQEETINIKKSIAPTLSLEEAVRGTTFIIEAVPEQLSLKHELYKRIERFIGPEVVLASNTSGLRPANLASVLLHPERFIVTHFWNPAHLVPLVEVAKGPFTNDRTVSRTMDLLKRMKKKPIELKKELPGFLGNRLQCALFREAQYLLEEGYASREDIDAAVVYGIGRRLSVTGPLASADLGGLDVFGALSAYLFPELCRTTKPFATLQQLVCQNKLGQKTGEGYYTWNKTFSNEIMKRREEELIRHLKQDLQNVTG